MLVPSERLCILHSTRVFVTYYGQQYKSTSQFMTPPGCDSLCSQVILATRKTVPCQNMRFKPFVSEMHVLMGNRLLYILPVDEGITVGRNHKL
jgi:hypothetical protein